MIASLHFNAKKSEISEKFLQVSNWIEGAGLERTLYKFDLLQLHSLMHSLLSARLNSAPLYFVHVVPRQGARQRGSEGSPFYLSVTTVY